MDEKKSVARDTLPTSIRLSPGATRLWQKLAIKMGLSKTGVLETAIRQLAKTENIQDGEPDAKT